MAQQTDNPPLNPALTATLPTRQRGQASESAAPAIALPFSEKYNRAHSQQYFDKHRATLSRRLSNWRETQLAREAEALEAFHRLGILSPQIVFCETRKAAGQHLTLLVTRSLDGFIDLNDFLHRQSEAQDRQLRWRALDRFAATLARLHSARWQHSALYAKHVFVAKRAEPTGNEADFDIALLDLEKARRRISVSQASRHDIHQFQRHAAGLDRNDWRHFLGRYSHCLARPGRRPAA